jgi:hypothetical protein
LLSDDVAHVPHDEQAAEIALYSDAASENQPKLGSVVSGIADDIPITELPDPARNVIEHPAEHIWRGAMSGKKEINAVWDRRTRMTDLGVARRGV